MGTQGGIYAGWIISVGNGNASAYVPQIFGDVPIVISDFVGAAAPGAGWVIFQGGDPEFPVWLSGTASAVAGGEAGADEVWIGPDEPPADTTEIWYDTDAVEGA